MSVRQQAVIGTALLGAVAAGTGAALGTIVASRGDIGGAPGISRALSRMGRLVGGGMLSGVAVVAGAATLVGLAVYESVRHLDA